MNGESIHEAIKYKNINRQLQAENAWENNKTKYSLCSYTHLLMSTLTTLKIETWVTYTFGLTHNSCSCVS